VALHNKLYVIQKRNHLSMKEYKMSENHENEQILAGNDGRGAPLTIGSIIVAISLESLSVGKQYIGSWEGNILFSVSFLFLGIHLIFNLLRWQKLNNLTGKKLYSLIAVYLLSIPFIYIINSFEHPSGFLFALFFLYFFLAITWTLLIEQRQITNLSILLFFLCLMPVVYGIYIHSNYEEQIDRDIQFLEKQVGYYRNHSGYLFQGIELNLLPWLDKVSIKEDIKNLGEGLEKAKKYYQQANYNKCNEEIKNMINLNEKLEDVFKWSNPEKKLSDELHDADNRLIWRYEQYCQLMSNATFLNTHNNIEKIISNLEEIKEDLNIVREKLNIAWNSYKNEEYAKSYICVMEVKAEYYGYFREIDEKMEMVKRQIGGAT